jgi:phosphate transport system protein
VKLRFDKTLEAINTQDSDLANSLMKGYRKQMTEKSESIVNGIVSEKLDFGTISKTTSISLYARYLKRIGAHLKNITTTIVNPFDSIGYKK